jgi:hypothetical protein
LEEDVDVTIQAFLGEERLVLLNGTPVGGGRPTRSWQPGEVIRDAWAVELPADLPIPALVRLDVGLFRPATLVPLQVRNLEGQDIPGAITYLRLEPDAWPVYEGERRDNITFGESIRLIGHDYSRADNRLQLTLYWQTLAGMDQDYTAFVHVLRPDGSLAAQSDVQPAHGHFPTSAWQVGNVVLSYHQIDLPADLPAANYTLVAGLYHPGDWVRLTAADQTGAAITDNAAPIEQLTLP